MSDQEKQEMDHKVLPEVKKAIDLFVNKTYDVSDLYSHIFQIIRDNSMEASEHKLQLERLIFKVEEMRENQRLYHGGHKQLLGACKSQEAEMDKKIMNLQLKGYSIERYKKQKPVQQQFFGK